MNILDVIRQKKVGSELSEEQINYFVDGYTRGEIPDYQAAALLMAIWQKGMTDEEMTNYTLALLDSGNTISVDHIHGICVDKHSTGGVGDKVSIALAPVVAALGLNMSKISGRGLGITGGTIDKLESIPGFKTELRPEEFQAILASTGICLIGQSEDIVPGDKTIYALRDVTETVDSIPLIAASIMSKKLAVGSQVILLDIKVGSGAFMKDLASARKLAKAMQTIGDRLERKVICQLTNMNQPLGRSIGNAIEVLEAFEFLNGRSSKDFREIVVDSAATLYSEVTGTEMLLSIDAVNEVIKSGKALDRFYRWVSAQGGDVGVFHNTSRLFNPLHSYDFTATSDGVLKISPAENLGRLAVMIGAGRQKKSDRIDNQAGIFIHHGHGEEIKKGQKIATLYRSSPFSPEMLSELANCFSVTRTPVLVEPLILERI